MHPITVPMMVKRTDPILTFGLLALVGAAILFVAYLLFTHHRKRRRAKKHGHSPHTGHHGNH